MNHVLGLTRRTFRNNQSLICAVAFVGIGVVAETSVRAEDANLPSAESILDRYIEVTGGKGAYEKKKSLIVESSIDAGSGIKIKTKRYQAPPNRQFTELEIVGMGKSEGGVDKGVAWEKNPMLGYRLKTGSEGELLKRDAEFNSELHWRELYKSYKNVGIENVDGRPAYKVELLSKEGAKPEHQFYDKDSGLLVKSVATIDGPMGEATLEQRHKDYKDVGGIKIAHRVEQKIGPQEMTVLIDKVEYDAEIPANRFDLPPEIKELAAKESALKPLEGKP